MRKFLDHSSMRRVMTVAAVALLAGVAGLHAMPAHAIGMGPSEQAQDRDEPTGRPGRPQRGEKRGEGRPEGRAPEARVPQPQMQAPPMMQAPQQMRGPEQRVPDARVPEVRAPEGRAPEVRAPAFRGVDRREPDMRFAAPRRFDYRAPPPRIVPRLPPSYRQYYWGGSPYYQFGGHWYRPYGSSFTLVAAPFGLFVPYLPAYYSTVWYGGTRYYVVDDTYYLYDPARRGYIVTRSPYGDDHDDDDGEVQQSAPSQELFVYPTRGQSEAQQSEDRYQCHRWAADQTHYDPTESEYREAGRVEYDRALTACLTGRGYSVK